MSDRRRGAEVTAARDGWAGRPRASVRVVRHVASRAIVIGRNATATRAGPYRSLASGDVADPHCAGPPISTGLVVVLARHIAQPAVAPARRSGASLPTVEFARTASNAHDNLAAAFSWRAPEGAGLLGTRCSPGIRIASAYKADVGGLSGEANRSSRASVDTPATSGNWPSSMTTIARTVRRWRSGWGEDGADGNGDHLRDPRPLPQWPCRRFASRQGAGSAPDS
jgi:hypothetical protein